MYVQLWDLDAGGLLQSIHLCVLRREYLYIDRYDTLSLVVHKQLNGVTVMSSGYSCCSH